MVYRANVTARLLGPDNINVNAICPGVTVTDMSRRNAETPSGPLARSG